MKTWYSNVGSPVTVYWLLTFVYIEEYINNQPQYLIKIVI